MCIDAVVETRHGLLGLVRRSRSKHAGDPRSCQSGFSSGRSVQSLIVITASALAWLATVALGEASDSDQEAFVATIRTQPVFVGKSELRLKLVARNNYPFPVRVMWTKTSCACAQPRVSGSGPMQPGDRRNVDFTISLPSTESVVNASLTIYGFRDGEPVPEGAKLSDALVLSTFRVSVPVVEPVKISFGGGKLEVRSSSDPIVKVMNRSGVLWGDIAVDFGLEGVSVVPQKLESTETSGDEEVWECRVRGLQTVKRLQPKEARVVVFRQMASETKLDVGFEEVFSQDISLDYVEDYRLLPRTVQFNSDQAFVVLDCSRGDAKSIAAKVKVFGTDGVEVAGEHLTVKALSRNWVRISFNNAEGEFDNVNRVEVSVPELNYSEDLGFRRTK